MKQLLCPNFVEMGISHGFCANAFTAQREDLRTEYVANHAIEHLYIPKQVHGVALLELSKEDLEDHKLKRKVETLASADGIVVKRVHLGPGKAIGVCSSDCVPLLFVSEEYFAAVHAGWRGLASGIIGQICDLLLERAQRHIRVAIGPCAGLERYEVGPEVIEAFAADESHYEERGGRLYLGLAGSAELQLRKALKSPDVGQLEELWISDLCTIADNEFCSYRREGKGFGSNLAFLAG